MLSAHQTGGWPLPCAIPWFDFRGDLMTNVTRFSGLVILVTSWRNAFQALT